MKKYLKRIKNLEPYELLFVVAFIFSFMIAITLTHILRYGY